MKVLMQNRITRRFLGKDAVWQRSTAKARNFGSSEKAIAYFRSHRLKNVQIVLRFEVVRYDIELPLTA